MAPANGIQRLMCCSRYFLIIFSVIILATACTMPTPAGQPQAFPVVTEGTGEGSQPAAWVIEQSDGFDQNANEWPDGERIINGEAYLDVLMTNGKYQWDVKTLTGSFFYVFPSDMPDYADFVASVDAACIQCEPQWDYGIFFRANENSTLYFGVNEEGMVKLLLHEDRFWSEVITPVMAKTFISGHANHLAVRAEGEQVTLWINQEEVARTTVGWLEAGKVGLAVSQSVPGKMQLAFDNWELQVRQAP